MNSGVTHSPMRWTIVPVLLLLLAAAMMTASAPANGAKTKKLPLLYKGNGYKLKPGLMYGWDPDGFGKPLRYLGKIQPSDPPGSAVKWSVWGKERAVGVGLARSSGCESGKCELGYPWNGTHLRVVAWRPRSGHFTRMKMTTGVPRESKRYYELVLAFRGPYVPDRTVSWKTVRVKRG